MKRRQRPPLRAVALCMAFATGCDLGLELEADETRAPEPIQGDAAKSFEPPPKNPWVGVVVARHRVDITSRVGGSVATLPVPVGGRVEPGDVVATLEDPEIRLGLEAAEASARSARSAVSRAKVNRRHARRQSGQAEQLGDIATEDEREQAEYAVARASADEAGARGELAFHRVEVERRREQLDALTLSAKFEGKVAVHFHALGEHVVPGAPLVRLVSDETLIRVAVPSADAATIAEGTRLEFRPEGSDYTLSLEVAHVAPEVDAASYVLVEARFVDADRTRRPRAGTRGHVLPARESRKTIAGDPVRPLQ